MDNKIDLGKISQGQQERGKPSEEVTEAHPSPAASIISVPDQSVIHNPDIAWIEATQSLQTNLVRSLRDYKLNFAAKRALSRQRERMITEVTEQYVSYLCEEARLASRAALEARNSLLRQELAKLKAQLFTQLADITGATVTELERIAQSHLARMTSPEIQQAYAKFVMTKIFDLLEQTTRD